MNLQQRLLIDHVEADHVQEWLDSLVDPGIIALNVETLYDTATDPNASILYPIAERLNWNITRFGHKARSQLRGWWVSGIDPFQNWKRMEWGRFKPDSSTPVVDNQKNKPAKYLSPSLGSGSSRLVLLDVPIQTWEKVSQRYGVPIGEDDKPFGFWCWVWKHGIPILITEGEKKAGCLLTLGFAAIALPGIFNGYRKETKKLIAELDLFATPGRQVLVCFDYETKSSTRQNVNLAISRLSRMFFKKKCPTQVICLPGPEKGVDDYVAAQGSTSFEALYQQAVSSKLWDSKRYWQLSYPASVELNQPYIEALDFPVAGAAFVKSPKGTGKTTVLRPLIYDQMQNGRRVLVLTHRVQLGRAICEDLGLEWIEDVRNSEVGELFGYGVCIDSLHPNSLARFNPQHWHGAIVIIDEVEQVLWHVLNSSTCYESRVKILSTLRDLIQTVITTGGLLIGQDADLADTSIEFFKSLVGEEIEFEPWLVVNEWKPEAGWNIDFYDTTSPAALITKMEAVISTGAVFVALDSQKAKGRWSSINLEFYLKSKFPDKRILRIDSESVADPEHPAYGIIERLNGEVQKFDIIIATPTIGTGISIDIRGHFSAVFGIFQGTIPSSEARQALARVRESVPRFVWSRPYGHGKIGNGDCSHKLVINSQVKAVKFNIQLLRDTDFNIDQQHDPVALRTWAKMAARVNASMWDYRDMLSLELEDEGHQVKVLTDNQTHYDQLGFGWVFDTHNPGAVELVQETLKDICDTQKQEVATAIANQELLGESEYNTLKNKRFKTKQERQREVKYEVAHLYNVPVTPDLILKHNEDWYPKLQLYYYLSQDNGLVRRRDRTELNAHISRGEGIVMLSDLRLLSGQIQLLRLLKIPEILTKQEHRSTDQDLIELAQTAKHLRHDIKSILNISISPKHTPIEVIQTLLGKFDLKLDYLKRESTPEKKRVRVYTFTQPQDGRQEIFDAWLAKEVSSSAPTEASPPPNTMDQTKSEPGLEATLVSFVLDQEIIQDWIEIAQGFVEAEDALMIHQYLGAWTFEQQEKLLSTLPLEVRESLLLISHEDRAILS
jgi:hypothetical protein